MELYKLCLILCYTSLTISHLEGAKYLNQRVKVLEQKITAISSEISLWQMDYEEVKSNLTDFFNTNVNNKRTNEKSASKYREKTKQERNNKEHDFYQRILGAFQAEKKHRHALEISLEAKLAKQAEKYATLHEELKSVKRKLADAENKLTECAADKSLQDVQQSINNLDSQMSRLQSTTDRKIDETCTAEITKLKDDVLHGNEELTQVISGVSTIKQQLVSNKVSFSARLGTSIENLQSYETVVFDSVQNNEGGAYNPSSGKFIAPKKGAYAFFTHILAQDRNMEMCIMKNGKCISMLFSMGIGHGHDANMVVLELSIGDYVNVAKHGRYGRPPFYVHHVWSTFSGFLLYST